MSEERKTCPDCGEEVLIEEGKPKHMDTRCDCGTVIKPGVKKLNRLM